MSPESARLRALASHECVASGEPKRGDRSRGECPTDGKTGEVVKLFPTLNSGCSEKPTPLIGKLMHKECRLNALRVSPKTAT